MPYVAGLLATATYATTALIPDRGQSFFETWREVRRLQTANDEIVEWRSRLMPGDEQRIRDRFFVEPQHPDDRAVENESYDRLGERMLVPGISIAVTLDQARLIVSLPMATPNKAASLPANV